jgi:hypothetical protein
MLYSTWQVTVKKKIHQPVEIFRPIRTQTLYITSVAPRSLRFAPRANQFSNPSNQLFKSQVILATKILPAGLSCNSWLGYNPEANDSAL